MDQHKVLCRTSLQHKFAAYFLELQSVRHTWDLADSRKFSCAGGFSSLQKSDLEMEIDLSSLGTFSTAMAAMFSKLGVPIKTAVPPMVCLM